jgi:hypothetical protein
MVLEYAHLQNWAKKHGVNVGVHIPAPWFTMVRICDPQDW